MKTLPAAPILALALAALALPAAAQEGGLPRAGSCKPLDTAGSATAVDWSGEDATVFRFGKSHAGDVVGMRPHDDGFKVSILYEDGIAGDSEILLFQLPDSSPPAFRLGTVSYETLPDGERVVKSVTSFRDVLCALVR